MGKDERPTNEFNENLFTLEQVQACLENTDPSGMTWLEYCQKQEGWTVEDMLRPLQIGAGRKAHIANKL